VESEIMTGWEFTKGVIPIIISLIAIGISVYSARKNSRDERFNLDFEFVKWFGSSNRADIPDFLWLTIINNSKLPCSILEISLAIEDRDGKIVKGIGRGNRVLISTSDTGQNGSNNAVETYSLDYPQNLNGYSSSGGYFHIYSSHNYYFFEEKNVKVTIKTNRGICTKNVFFDMGKNIYRVLQNKTRGEEPRVTQRENGSEIVFIDDGI